MLFSRYEPVGINYFSQFVIVKPVTVSIFTSDKSDDIFLLIDGYHQKPG